MAETIEIIEVDGRKYHAIQSPIPGRCGNCVFKKGFGCDLWVVNKGDTKCSPKTRLDGLHVYWVHAHTAARL